MQAAAKVGIGLGVAAATAGTLAWGKANYDDAVANRHNDRNALVNMGLWFGTVGAGAASGVAHFKAKGAAPWLYGATALLGANAFLGAATLENGWERSGTAYCNYGICNRVAQDRYDTSSFYLGRPNPMGDDAP
jgi:hypothetical protein